MPKRPLTSDQYLAIVMLEVCYSEFLGIAPTQLEQNDLFDTTLMVITGTVRRWRVVFSMLIMYRIQTDARVITGNKDRDKKPRPQAEVFYFEVFISCNHEGTGTCLRSNAKLSFLER